MVTLIETHSDMPRAQSLMWLIAVFPVEAAKEDPLTSMILAPLLPTLGLNQVSTQVRSRVGLLSLPFTVVEVRSGYIVGEWLPQIPRFLMSLTLLLTLEAS